LADDTSGDNGVPGNYPDALEAFDSLADRDVLAALGCAPTPAEAAHLSLAKIRSTLKALGGKATVTSVFSRSPQCGTPT
jgi:hypothetical protein